MNLFKLWGIKKISRANSASRTLEKIGSVVFANQGHVKDSSDEDGGLPESGDEEEKFTHDQIKQKRVNN